ncbi:MAG: SGNH/GDSL hydrolase family protein [Lachnospiraceae bacterium]|nr:SGNH/GDSL hydrolase family protein [Lachnospiraceae bacterium]
MKRVLLLGDSIRMGYDKKVRELLKDEYEVFFAEEDNGRFAAYTMWQANQFFKHYGHFDLVHWNNGYWDMNIEAPMTEPIHPIAEYVSFLERIIRLIQENGAQIVFATTTPIYEDGNALDNTGTAASINYCNDWVVKYNEAARQLMEAKGIVVNDLYSLCLQGPKYYKCEDMLHLTEEGYDVIASHTADLIRKILK